MPQIFLSYSRSDQSIARRFAEALQREGFDVWWDQTLQAGDAYDKVTEAALREAKAVVVLWSKTSVESRWVRAEATLADRNRTLIPAMIEPCERPIMFELTHTADLAHWKGETNDPAWRAFVADVQRFVGRDTPAPVAAPSTAALPRATSVKSSGRSSAVRLALIAIPIVLIAAGAAYFALHGRETPPVAATAIAAPATRVPAAGTSLAVLPFADMSPQRDQEYFSDGLSEELLNELAQVRDLRVAGRTSSFSFKGKNEDLRVIGQKLGVGHLLEGSVRKAGEQLRITAQLIDASTGAHLWSQTYDRKLEDVFAVQEEVSKDVAKALRIKLDVGDMSRAKGGTTDLEAYDKYLRAQQLGYQRGPREVVQELQLYEEAVALDPRFSRAWYGLYQALGIQGALLYLPERTPATLKRMEEVSARLESLSPDAWWTNAMRVGRYLSERRWADADAAQRALQASAPPSELTAVQSRAIFLRSLGRAREGVAEMERVRDLDPLAMSISGALHYYYLVAERPHDARKEYERSKSLVGDRGLYEWRALTAQFRQPGVTPADIRRQYDDVLKYDRFPIPLTPLLYRLLGDRGASLAEIRKALTDPAFQDSVRMLNVAEWADVYGDGDLSLAAARRSLIDLGGTQYVLWGPSSTGYRTKPAFKQLLRDLKMADYFRASGNWGDFCKPVGADDFECR